ncbi:PRC-barrel domain-containing protein [Tenggerimyces flavus]|uniref:PRC-barrel domain-containing protein n=1 Tax=Tenggerimyces flavus TaxID=1708749 RepID=A0ABV7YLE9_9ACTN|nr:PRC-barrel domain-containing protein [Tenggerimyces flavus]MBM7790217.1 sporulation protein YlmC with PRC-barrel domain [Tenggerimyces flavus]
MGEDAQSVLVRLGDTDLTVADGNDDVRGRVVVDRSGEEIGDVDGLLIDEEERRVRFLQVGSGGFLGIGTKKQLIPVDAVTRVDEDAVHIDVERDRVAAAPVYDPDLAQDLTQQRGFYEGLYGYYGYSPHWLPGYVYPGYPHNRR